MSESKPINELASAGETERLLDEIRRLFNEPRIEHGRVRFDGLPEDQRVPDDDDWLGCPIIAEFSYRKPGGKCYETRVEIPTDRSLFEPTLNTIREVIDGIRRDAPKMDAGTL